MAREQVGIGRHAFAVIALLIGSAVVVAVIHSPTAARTASVPTGLHVVSQQGSNVTITNASYNGSIPAGASVNPGFNGSWSGSNPSPTSFKLNGTTCS